MNNNQPSKKHIFFHLLTKLGCFFILLIALFFCIFPQYSNTLTGSLLDKVARLKSIDEPKLVLIGNSNLIYGIDSELLEKEIGMPVVNMGLHGGLGNLFHERMMDLNIHEGDIYIVCHSLYWDANALNDPVLTWVTVEEHPSLWSLIKLSDSKDMYQSFSTYIKHGITHYNNCDDMNEHTRNEFNEYGDYATYRPNSSGFYPDGGIFPTTLGDNETDRLNEWNDYLASKGATLLVAGYPIVKCDITSPESDFVANEIQLKKMLDCPYISDCRDYMFDVEYFHDSYLHLTTEGAQLRTRQLIADITNWKKTNKIQ